MTDTLANFILLGNVPCDKARLKICTRQEAMISITNFTGLACKSSVSQLLLLLRPENIEHTSCSSVGSKKIVSCTISCIKLKALALLGGGLKFTNTLLKCSASDAPETFFPSTESSPIALRGLLRCNTSFMDFQTNSGRFLQFRLKTLCMVLQFSFPQFRCQAVTKLLENYQFIGIS